MSVETEIFPEETHLYAASLNTLAVYRPTTHLYWPERRLWVHFTDDLPKYPKGLQIAARRGRKLL